MAHVLIRALALLRRPWVTGALAGLILGGIFLVRLPLFGVPGFELSAVLTLAVALLGGGIGIAAARQETILVAGTGTRPSRARRIESPVGATFAAASAAATLLVFAIAFPLGASLGFAHLSTRCNPFAQLGFFPLLTLPAAALAGAVGTFAGFATRRLWLSWVVYLLFVFASLAHTLAPVVLGPQVFAFDFFGGYFPGPLYDESLAIPRALWSFRLQTLAVATAFASLSALTLNLRTGWLGRPYFRIGALLLVIGSAAMALGIEDRAQALGIRQTDAGVMETLGGTRDSAHLKIFFPRTLPPQTVDRFVRDAEFRYAQLQTAMGEAPPGQILVFLYASPEQKAQLVGARQTQFSKPWQRAVHLNPAPFPHSALKHELVHAFSSLWGIGPFRVPGRGLTATSLGLVEGLAVALDPPRTELGFQHEAAALRRAKLAPNVREVFDPRGFYGTAGARAYLTAGAFVSYLLETYGRDKLKAVYASGDFEAAYGRSLNTLAYEWERYLDALPLDEGALARTVGRYRQESLFARACAREVASLSERAAEALIGQPQEALALYTRCALLQPQEPRFALGRAAALERLRRPAEADQILRALEPALKESPSLLAEVTLARADLAWRSGGNKTAEPLLSRALALAPSPEVERTAQVKLYALQHPALTRALLAYFEPSTEDVRLLLLDRARAKTPDDPFVSYLFGRRLLPHSPAQAAPSLSVATHAAPEAVRREAWRLWMEALYTAGDCAGVRDAVGHLPDLGSSLREAGTEWQERCAFDEAHFSGPLVPEDPFR